MPTVGLALRDCYCWSHLGACELRGKGCLGPLGATFHSDSEPGAREGLWFGRGEKKSPVYLLLNR